MKRKFIVELAITVVDDHPDVSPTTKKDIREWISGLLKDAGVRVRVRKIDLD